MKKFLFLAAALIAMGCGMSSCSNEAEVTKQTEQAPKLTKLTFTVAQDAQTRATWGEGAYKNTPMFETGDKVSLFSEHNTNVELTASVDAVGNVTLSGEGYSGDTDLYFVYPYYEDGVSYTSGVIRGSAMNSSNPYYFGSEKINPGIGKYPSKALSLAKSADGGASAITFQGLLPIIKFTPSSNCKGFIKIDAGANLIPYCYLTINTAQSKVVEEASEGNERYRSLPKTDNYISFSAGTSYYFAVPPFSMVSGGKIKFIDDDDNEYTLFTATADKDFVAGKIYSLKYGSTGGSVVFAKNDWTASGNTLTATKDGITITLTRSSSNDITKASTGAITFTSATEDETMTIKVTNASDAQLPCNLTNSATDMTLTGDGSWTLTYSSSPVGWLTTGGLAFIGLNIPKTATFTVDY